MRSLSFLHASILPTVLVAGLAWCGPALGQASFRRGDVDGDGQLGTGDLVELIIHNFYMPPGAPPCEDAADVNDDGLVNVDDLVAVITSWGDCPMEPEACPEDINNDGVVDVNDLVWVVVFWS